MKKFKQYTWFLHGIAFVLLALVTMGQGCPADENLTEEAIAPSASSEADEGVAPGPSGTGTTQAVSLTAGTSDLSTLGPSDVLLSDNGRWVALISSDSQLVEGQDNGYGAPNNQLFLHDRMNRTTVLVSHRAESNLAIGDGPTEVDEIDMSADARYIAYASQSNYLVDAPMLVRPQIYVYNRETGKNELISHKAGHPNVGGNYQSRFPSISADGRYVVFSSPADSLISGQQDQMGTYDLFIYDRTSDEMTLVTHQAERTSFTANGDTQMQSSLSANGRYVAYSSNATDLVDGFNDLNGGSYDYYLFDRETGENILISSVDGVTSSDEGVEADVPSISADGRYVAYVSSATNLGADFNGFDEVAGGNVYLFDRDTRTNTLVSHMDGAPMTVAGDTGDEPPVISADGRFVVYISEAPNIVGVQNPDYPVRNVYLWDRRTGRNQLVSHNSSLTTQSGAENAFNPIVSADGRFVVFESDAPDHILEQIDDPQGFDTFLYDRNNQSITLISHAAGSDLQATNGSGSGELGLSTDGRVVLFMSRSDAIMPNGGNGEDNPYVYIRD